MRPGNETIASYWAGLTVVNLVASLQYLQLCTLFASGLNPGTDFAVEVAPLDFGDTQKGDLVGYTLHYIIIMSSLLFDVTSVT